MPLRSYKPTSPGRRFMTRSTFEEITTDEPHKPLLESHKRGSGRNNQGRMTVRHRGGGEKRNYRIIDFKRDKWGVPATLATDRVRPQPLGPYRPAPLPRRREALHARCRTASRSATSSSPDRTAEARVGNALPLANIPLGTTDPQHRAGARQGRPDRPLRRRRGPAAGQGGGDGPGPPPVRRGAPHRACAASPRSARWATSTTRTRASARPVARATWASGPRCAAWS